MVEYRVNGYQSNWQESPHVAAMPDGGWIIVYEGYFDNYDGSNLSTTYVAAQRYDANGTARGPEMFISAFDDTSASDPRIAVLNDGGYVVTWSFSDYGAIITRGTRTRAQVFNADGSARSPVIAADVAASIETYAPEVVARGDGGFTLSWGIGISGGLSEDDVRMRHYTPTGRAISGDLRLNTRVDEFSQVVTRSATLADGKAVIIWGSEATIDNDGPGVNDVRASLIGADGHVLKGDFHLLRTTGSAGNPTNYGYDVTALANGGFAVVAEDYAFRYGDDLEGRFIMLATYNAAGEQTLLKRAIHVPSNGVGYASVAQLATGELVVTWSAAGPDGGDGRDVFGQLVSVTGTPLTGAFEISTNRFSYDDQVAPEVTALHGGGFVVTYTSDSIDADDEGIAMRIFGRATDGNDVQGVDVTGRLAGLGGNDRLTGNARANVLDGGSGNDQLLGLDGNDQLRGGFGSGNDALMGDSGNDVLEGGAGDDRLKGGSGNDRLAGGPGNDVLNGEAGFDYANLVDSTSGVRVNLGTTAAQRVSGNLGSDRLISIEGIVGSTFDDRLVGNGGHNALNGGAGRDVLVGGSGNDTLDGGAGTDVADYSGRAALRIDLGTSASQNTGQGLDRLISIEDVIGGAGRDRIQGSASANTLVGKAGFDTLLGGAGSDTLDGGTGNDLLDGGFGRDVIRFGGTAGAVVNLARTGAQTTGHGNDTLRSIEGAIGGSGNDRFAGNDSANSFIGNAGNDTLSGGNGNDLLNGGSGHDRILGSRGNDTLSAGSGNDVVDGGAGIDRFLVRTSANINVDLASGAARNTGEGTDRLISVEQVVSGRGRDLLVGNNAANLLSSGAGQDRLWGGAGDDRLDGGSDIDRLTGGTGNDILLGGSGNDVFVFARANGVDRIADFEGDADRMLIQGGLGFDDLTITSSGSDTWISLTGTRIVLEDVQSWSIESSDFVFG